MNCSQIIRQHLEENGFDGLVNPELCCGCTLDDLFPCSEWYGECQPGYRTGEPRDSESFMSIERPDNQTHLGKMVMWLEDKMQTYTVSEICLRYKVQCCHMCDDFECGDNMLEQSKKYYDEKQTDNPPQKKK